MMHLMQILKSIEHDFDVYVAEKLADSLQRLEMNLKELTRKAADGKHLEI